MLTRRISTCWGIAILGLVIGVLYWPLLSSFAPARSPLDDADQTDFLGQSLEHLTRQFGTPRRLKDANFTHVFEDRGTLSEKRVFVRLDETETVVDVRITEGS